MTHGEAGLAVFFSTSAFLCLIAAAKALDTAFAFHASLGAAASLVSVFVILNRYFDRSATLPMQEINGRPNYNLGPVKFSAVMAVFWGIAGFAVGLIIVCQLAWPALNFDLPWTSFGRMRPLHTSAVIFAFGGNVLIATSFYVVQTSTSGDICNSVRPLANIATASAFYRAKPSFLGQPNQTYAPAGLKTGEVRCRAIRTPRSFRSRNSTNIIAVINASLKASC
jgi:cytochrome c oxidase cbb3-type subunit 1